MSEIDELFNQIKQVCKRRDVLILGTFGLAKICSFKFRNPLAPHSIQAAEIKPRQSQGTISATGQNLLPNTQLQIMTVVNGVRMPTEAGTSDLPVISVTGNNTTVEGYQNLLTVYCTNTSNLRVGDLLAFQPPADLVLRQSISPFESITWTRVERIDSRSSFTVGLNHFCYNNLGLHKSISSNACEAYVMTRGDTDGTATEGGIGRGHDRWWRTPQLKFWKDTWTANAKVGSKNSLGIKKAVNGEEFFWCEFNQSNTYLYQDVENLRGRQVVFGAWGNHKVKQGSGYWRLIINQFDTNGNFISSAFSPQSDSRGYQWREVTQFILPQAGRVRVGFVFYGNANDVYYMSQPMLTYGNHLGEGNYTRPESEIFTCSRSLVPSTFFGATVNFPLTQDGSSNGSFLCYGFPVRLDAETNGKVDRTVKKLYLMLEGTCNVIGRAFGIRNQELGPHNYGIAMYSKVPGIIDTYGGIVTLWNGDMYVYAANSPENNNWYYVYFDLSAFFL